MDKTMNDKMDKEFVGNKIKKLLGEGKKKSQAVAIALSMARQKKSNKA